MLIVNYCLFSNAKLYSTTRVHAESEFKRSRAAYARELQSNDEFPATK